MFLLYTSASTCLQNSCNHETVLFSGLVQSLIKQCIESRAQNKCLKLNINNAAMVVLVSTGSRGASGCGARSFLHSLERPFHLEGDRCGRGWSQPRRLEDGADERMRHSPTDKTSTCDAKPGKMPDVNSHAHVQLCTRDIRRRVAPTNTIYKLVKKFSEQESLKGMQMVQID